MNYDFCKTTLDRHSRTHKANMNELGIITLLAAIAQARVNKYVVNELFQKEIEPIMVEQLANCFIDYTVTLGKLQGAYRLSYEKDYNSMIQLVNNAMKMSTKCENRFRKPPIRTSPITDYNQKMVWFTDMASVVLEMLDN
ncbi:unnamed protein product [Camellia sinensis]|uniref:Pectinesterase inhibitor domain-containing protein n=1 Tax=Camellia sinensis var. sinensis TaxID=542762 RepID=A0A4S4EYM4_CAMSN|nr:putative invertase inhibitor [Camellia sinensis]THG22159.1 hypothetical protein TEA_025209 [Camellia sinensis var. sinensis]